MFLPTLNERMKAKGGEHPAWNPHSAEAALPLAPPPAREAEEGGSALT